MGNSFLQQFFMQQNDKLAAAGVFFVKNQYRDEHPYYWLKKPLTEATRTGQTDASELFRIRTEFFSFVDPKKFNAVYHMYTGVLFGDPSLCTVEKAKVALEALSSIVANSDVRLFTFIRRQDKFIESYFLQKLQGGQNVTFDDYLHAIDMRHVDWNELLLFSEDIFGRERIEVQPFECIYAGEKSFLELCTRVFMDPTLLEYDRLNELPKNRSYSEVAVKIAQVANPLLDPTAKSPQRKTTVNKDLT
jgi:hypothetical protein